MFHRYKRLKAFTTGCLASLVVFGYPAQLLAQSNSLGDPIQGVTSTTQEAPTTTEEVNDVMTGLAAGVGIGDLIEPKPDPIREHTAFMSSMWNVLLDSNYSVGNSYLTTGEWLSGPTGTLTATNESGNSVDIDIPLSLEILPTEFSVFDQETLDELSSVSARIGIAWTNMSNANLVESNILIWWFQWDTPSGTKTAIGPLTTISEHDMDLIRSTVPLMGDFFDDPLNYNNELYDSSIFGVWSDFRSAVSDAFTTGVIIVAGALATGVVGVIAGVSTGVVATAAAAVAAASAVIYAAIILAVVAVILLVDNAIDDLRRALEDLGFDTSGMSDQDIQDLAEILINA